MPRLNTKDRGKVRLWEQNRLVGSVVINRHAIVRLLSDGMISLGFAPNAAETLAHLHCEALIHGVVAKVEREINETVLTAPLEWLRGRLPRNLEIQKRYLDELIGAVADMARVSEQPHLVLASPFVRFVRTRVHKQGVQEQRRALKAIVRQLLKSPAGRPPTALILAERVEETRQRLAPAFQLVQERKNAGGFESSDERITPQLVRMGCDQKTINVLLKHRTLNRAAAAAVAAELDLKPESVRVMASRAGKKKQS